MTDKLAKVESADVSRSTVDAIVRMAQDPSLDAEKLGKLLAMQRELLEDQRRTAYRAALAELQAELPQVGKAGTIQHTGSRYAKLEDIDVSIRPLCAKHGFSFSFDSEEAPKGIKFSCTMAHREGHAETKTMTLPIDSGAGRSSVQAVGSSTSYARRYLLSMHLHLITREEDDDGRGGCVTAEQALKLQQAVLDAGGSTERFLKWAGAESFETIAASKYQSALKFCEEKKRQGR